ncbi:hypothetical protein AJ78_02700 [Emergomyces pasteurianus Ep9510]|uniref:Uncharacterized protein n=1 Tax=Emergomyces pasteurianus Ep9510 TaxID=1447872 RepID=A0A1J9QM04_9EURO|nr:hypothetical protein AJ78_02700 [Emergomyces pasteurianus Ep9510]
MKLWLDLTQNLRQVKQPSAEHFDQKTDREVSCECTLSRKCSVITSQPNSGLPREARIWRNDLQEAIIALSGSKADIGSTAGIHTERRSTVTKNEI